MNNTEQVIELIKYNEINKKINISMIAEFFCFHFNFIENEKQLNSESFKQAKKTLNDWLVNDNMSVYNIQLNNEIIGFLRISFKGGNVAWLDDIFVNSMYRRKGVATKAIEKTEVIVKNTLGYNALCIDVVPRNIEAIKLYYKLGFDSISIITLRKEFTENNPRNEKVDFLGFSFNK